MENTHTLIYGASDDIVAVEGQLCAEYENYTLAKRGIPFECSDQTKGTITYDGDWKITVEKEGDLFQELRPNVGDNGKHLDLALKCTSYSDVLILKDGIIWVKINGKKV
jgi:hypothetical protein